LEFENPALQGYFTHSLRNYFVSIIYKSAWFAFTIYDIHVFNMFYFYYTGCSRNSVHVTVSNSCCSVQNDTSIIFSLSITSNYVYHN
jgi:hypothetical protein